MADDEIPIGEDCRPRLQPFVRLQYDQTRSRWILQAPERVLVLDETGKEILEHCDGATSLNQIVARLAAEYDAPQDMIAHDVRAVLELLAGKGLLLLEEVPPNGEAG